MYGRNNKVKIVTEILESKKGKKRTESQKRKGRLSVASHATRPAKRSVDVKNRNYTSKY